MFKTNYMNYGETSQSKDGVCICSNETREKKKRYHLYKALFDVHSLYNLFKVMLSVMLITLTLVAFVGICCGVVMLILNAPIAGGTLILSIIAFGITAFITLVWLFGINGGF